MAFVAGGILIASLFLCQDLYRKVIFSFYPYYENTYFDVADLSLTNIAKCIGTLLLAFILYRCSIRDNQVNRFYFFLNIGGFVLYTCGTFIPEVSRIGYYMIISQVFLIPNMLMEMKKESGKRYSLRELELLFRYILYCFCIVHIARIYDCCHI